MSIENEQTGANPAPVVDTSNQQAPAPDLSGVQDYKYSPHKGFNPNEVVDDKQLNTTPPAQQDGQLYFGKYKSLDDAQKGYQSAEAKIREQGAELNKTKSELEAFKPMEDYTSDNWTKKVESWKSEKLIPEGATYDPNIPEINMLLKGFEKAGVSEKQAREILAGATERQIAMIEERQEAIQKELGVEGMKKVQALVEFGSKLSPEDATVLESLFTFPYVEAKQVDLMHRLLCNISEKSIPANLQAAPATKSSMELRQDIAKFERDNSQRLSTDQTLQDKHKQMWENYAAVKNKGL